MKKISFLLFEIVFLLFSFSAIPAKGTGKTAFTLKRGVNISHWLSQTEARGDVRRQILTENQIKMLSEWGFDHLRLPVDEVQLFSEDGKMDEETMSLAEDAISWCRKYGMKVVFDLHSLRSHDFNKPNNPLFTDATAQQRMCQYWTQIARRLRKQPVSVVAFELMNEPVADKNEEWNNVAKQVIAAIRKVSKKRVIVLGSNKWDAAYNLPDLYVPENDPNIILTFHFYEPMILTHYTASWTNLRDVRVGHIQYPGRPISEEDFNQLDHEKQKKVEWFYKSTFNYEWMRNRWKAAIDFSKQKGLQLYLGEFGCLPAVGPESRFAWFRDVMSLCKEFGIGYALWDFKAEFGFANWKNGTLKDPEMLKILTE